MLKSEFNHGACSSTAERLTVDEEVEGSKPSRHPEQKHPDGCFCLLPRIHN